MRTPRRDAGRARIHCPTSRGRAGFALSAPRGEAAAPRSAGQARPSRCNSPAGDALPVPLSAA